MPTSLPNLLTFSRIAVIPLLVAAFYVESPLGNIIACALFALASLTDYLDGYLARAWRQQSNLGRFLDPVADKLMVAAAILMLVAFDRLSGWSVLAALVILCREILVSGLREFLAELRIGLPVSRLAKWKTAIQMVSLTLLLLGDAGPSWLDGIFLGDVALWIAAGLTLITGYDYLRAGARHMHDETHTGAAAPAPGSETAAEAARPHESRPPEARAKSAGAGPV